MGQPGIFFCKLFTFFSITNLQIIWCVSYFWKCSFCEFKIGGKAFATEKARIHLSGCNEFRNGLIAQVCVRAPAHIKKKFCALVVQKRQEKEEQARSKKRARELMEANSPQVSPVASRARRSRQQRLSAFCQYTERDAVDDAWGKAFFGLDIAGNKIDAPLFKEAIATTKSVKARQILWHAAMYVYEYNVTFMYACMYAATNRRPDRNFTARCWIDCTSYAETSRDYSWQEQVTT